MVGKRGSGGGEHGGGEGEERGRGGGGGGEEECCFLLTNRLVIYGFSDPTKRVGEVATVHLDIGDDPGRGRRGRRGGREEGGTLEMAN